MPVDTKTAPRRILRFESIDQVLRELETLKAAHEAGTLRTTGNWTPGQNFGHMASWIEFAYDGYPPGRPPLPHRIVIKAMKKKFLRSPRAGIRIPRVEAGTFAVEPMEFDAGYRRLTAALTRLDREAPPLPSPAFGKLTHEQYKQLHLRHAELHLGFLQPK